MSYDVGVKTPGQYVEAGNYTSNCGPMFRKALPETDGLNGLHTMSAAEAIPLLITALRHMNDNWSEYVALNPENGWGDAEGARAFLASILLACCNAPRGVVEVDA